MVLDARQDIPHELVIPLYVWMRQDPAWTGSRTAIRIGQDAMTQNALDAHLAAKYPVYMVRQWCRISRCLAKI